MKDNQATKELVLIKYCKNTVILFVILYIMLRSLWYRQIKKIFLKQIIYILFVLILKTFLTMQVEQEFISSYLVRNYWSWDINCLMSVTLCFQDTTGSKMTLRIHVLIMKHISILIYSFQYKNPKIQKFCRLCENITSKYRLLQP